MLIGLEGLRVDPTSTGAGNVSPGSSPSGALSVRTLAGGGVGPSIADLESDVLLQYVGLLFVALLGIFGADYVTCSSRVLLVRPHRMSRHARLFSLGALRSECVSLDSRRLVYSKSLNTHTYYQVLLHLSARLAPGHVTQAGDYLRYSHGGPRLSLSLSQ